MKNKHHSFHGCPLRSSSLLIINKQNKTIVTATDEVFDMLGYEPHHLIGQSIHLLQPQQGIHHSALNHGSLGQIPFDICIHHDPLCQRGNLDYWLIRPTTALTTSSSFTILQTNQFGTIDQAHASPEFPQMPHELVGHPIMSFVHQEDVRLLCDKFSQIQRLPISSFQVRWLRQHPKYNHQAFDWVSLMVIQIGRVGDPQTRPICIIRPVNKPRQVSFDDSICLHLIQWFMTQTKNGMNGIYHTIEAIHIALDQGKVYLLEFLAHAMTSMISLTDDLMQHYVGIEEDEHVYKDALSNHHKYMPRKERRRRKKKACHDSLCMSIKVSIDNYIWSVPLFVHHKPYAPKNKALCMPE
ncbi:uncharacterized protein B0P05DRAFT_556614 [Gilbertella persicaria]|uniref:uncharacterized protein n=1 Tax=Gilbertella persicaria TaxID=101096 RepID=UPI00221E5216|nr:uncharacterized protein B0P05DRAFT_556614 [Gilbertella persicaria]KAI8062342.1 hypothetical protein B0P05DRAFT_556614 [Gilbertella persicaria]